MNIKVKFHHISAVAMAMVLAVGATQSAAAEEAKSAAMEQIAETTNIICPALEKASSYKGKSANKYIVQGADGYVFRSRKDLKSNFTLLPETLKKFKDLSEAFKKQDIELVYIMPPTRGIALSEKIPKESRFIRKPFDLTKAQKSYEGLLEVMTENGLQVVDFTKADYTTEPFYNRRDHHWRPNGAKIAASLTADLIKELPAYQDFPQQTFETLPKGDKNIRGSFERFIEKICKSKIKDDRIPYYKTTEILDAAEQDAMALFGEEEEIFPSLVLVGTSNTTEPEPSYANFAGWLREDLSTDIYNPSVNGGGLSTSILSYLGSDIYRDHKPKIIMWEVATHYNFSKDLKKVFQEAIAGAQGSCDGEALFEGIIEKEGASLVLKKLKVKPQETYMRLRLSTPLNKAFTVSLEGKSGRIGDHAFKISKRANPVGLYSVLVPRSVGDIIKGVEVSGLPPSTYPIHVQICPSRLKSEKATLLPKW